MPATAEPTGWCGSTARRGSCRPSAGSILLTGTSGPAGSRPSTRARRPPAGSGRSTSTRAADSGVLWGKFPLMRLQLHDFRLAHEILEHRPGWDELSSQAQSIEPDDVLETHRSFALAGRRTPAGAQTAINQ